MTTTVIRTGVDTHILLATAPNANFGSAAYPVASYQAGIKAKILVQLPILVTSAPVISATLSVPLRGGASSGIDVNVTAIGAAWDVSSVTANDAPATVGSATTTTIPSALGDGDTLDLDVTALVQAVMAGQANYGWMIDVHVVGISPVSVVAYGFDSGHESWTLTIEASDQPVAPTQLSPDGVVSLDKWVCQLGDADDIAQIDVQVDPAANTASPAFDSGWVSTTTPTLDLASTAYAGLADGSSTYWRAAFKTSTGAVSAFSDWVQVTRHVKPSLVMDNPPAGLVYDSTPTIQAHLSPAGSATTRWQVRVLSATDASVILYDSGSAITGATLAHTIPHTWRNKVVIPSDGTYRLQVYCWDRSDRVGSYGDAPYVLVDETLTVDVDGTIATPSGLTVSQPAGGVPDVVLHWTATADPDYFLAYRLDGTTWSKIPFQIDPASARVSPGVFEWVDAAAPPNSPHTWRVRAVVGDKQSAPSVSASLTPDVTGVWIRSDFGTVTLAGPSPTDGGMSDAVQTDKRTTYSLPYAFEDVDVIGAVAGMSGTMDLTIDNRTLGSWSQDVDAARTILEQVRQHPEKPVQLIWGTSSIPAYLRGLSVAPVDSAKSQRIHRVTGGYFQTDDVQQAGFGVGYYGAGTYY